MILISGFKPFKKAKINPSEILVQDLSHLSEVKTVVLPVEFECAFTKLKESILTVNPTCILMFGQAAGRTHICLEKIALNWIQTEFADESGVKPMKGKISTHDELAIMARFPIDDLFEKLKAQSLPVELSFSAGTFVCNNLYYKVLKEFPHIPSLFIHVPLLPEQVADIGASSHGVAMHLDQMQKCLRAIIDYCRLNI